MADIGLLNGDCYAPGEYERPWEGYNGVVNPIGLDNAVDEDFSMYDRSSVETECAIARYNACNKVGQPKMKSITSKYAKKNIHWTGSTIQQIGDPVGPTGDDGLKSLSSTIDSEILKEIIKQKKWLTKEPGSDQQE